MVVRWLTLRNLWRAAAGVGTLCALALPLQAQSILTPGSCAPPPACATPGPIFTPPSPLLPGSPAQPAPSMAPISPPVSTQTDLAPNPALTASSVALGGGGFSAPSTAVGYIDSAVPTTMFRLRFDAADGDNRPDRAEFFYPKCGCFNLVGIKAPGLGPLSETKVDYQELSSYLEYAFGQRFSAFVETPARFLEPQQNADTAGLGDMNVGFKYALIANDDQYVTFQFRTYIPTGAPSQGLGTDHVSFEPAGLWHQPLGENLALDGEFRAWIPVGGTDFEGNVLREGIGISYAIGNKTSFRMIPVGEIVAWEVLSGKELAVPEPNIAYVKSASGETIVNAKFGVRFGFGEQGPALLSRSDLYIGYGRALTGDVWYKDIVRVEYRLRF